jgi:hypothetical protein
MKSVTHDRPLARRNWFRICLLFLAATALVVGFWALFLPRSFYEDFPLSGRDWVSALGPYNEHLVRDVGAMNLALGALLALAAIILERRLVQVSLVAWLVYAIPHFVFHLANLHPFSLGDKIGNMVGLGLVILLPLVLFALAYAESSDEKSESTPNRRSLR